MNFEWMKGIDIFGKQIEFKIEGRDSYKSLPGALMSIMYGISMIVVAGLTFQNYFRTDMPGLVGESYQRQLYPKIDLVKSKMTSPSRSRRSFGRVSSMRTETLLWKSISPTAMLCLVEA